MIYRCQQLLAMKKINIFNRKLPLEETRVCQKVEIPS